MWKTRVLGVVGAAILLSGGTALAANSKNFGTHLKGHHERPIPRDTHAQGQATFQVNEDGTVLHYKLNVANIENVTQAHIHLGPSDGTGQIVAWLYPASGSALPGGGGRIQGRIADGAITAGDLKGPLAGQPLSALIAAIEAGNTYVNVHTDDGEAPANSGPGDFPGGEVRGQLP